MLNIFVLMNDSVFNAGQTNPIEFFLRTSIALYAYRFNNV